MILASLAALLAATSVTTYRGVTFLEKPLVLTPADSGRVFEGEGDAVLSVGVRLGPWRNAGKGVWEADAPKEADGRPMFFDQLWVNGRRAANARLPNAGHFSAGKAACTAVTNAANGSVAWRETVTFTNAAVDALAAVPASDYADLQVEVVHLWSFARRTPQAYDAKTRTLTMRATSPQTRWQKWDGRTFFAFANVRSAFDAAGEWFLDRAAGKVRYRPLPGENMAHAEVIAPRRDCRSVVEFRGDPEKGEYVRDVVFRNISFAHTAAATDGNGPHLKNQYQAACFADGAVFLRGAQGCAFENCRVTHVGGYGFRFGSGCVSNRVVGCTLEDLGAGGVWMGEEFGNHEQGPKRKGPPVTRRVIRPDLPTCVAFNLVSNCTIRCGGRYDPEGTGVALGHVSDTRIVHNDIHDLYYSGVSVGWTWGFAGSVAQRNEIAFNRIWDLGKGVMSDMGGVYTLGTSFGTTVHDNVIHDVRAYAYGGWALYCDEGSEGIVMERNLCWNTTDGGFHQHYGTGCVIRNNIFAFNRKLGAVRMQRDVVKDIPCTLHFHNNIVYVNEGPLCGRGVRKVGGVWANNVWFDARGKEEALFDGLGWDAWAVCGKETGSVYADPLFENAEGYDFRLKSASPAFASGFKAWDYSKAGVDSAKRPVPNANQAARIRAGIELWGIVHWGLNTFTDSEWGFGDEDPKLLDPDAFDADQIVGACKAGGLQGLVVVAKHHDGFCLWPTKTTAHNIAQSPFRGGKGDYVGEMAAACRRAGLKFGVYCSPWDRNSAHYGTDRYVELYHAQIKELLDGRYGDVFEMWFDGANGGDGYYGGQVGRRKIPAGYYRFDEVFSFVRKLQPGVCIFAGEDDTSDLRWPGNEQGVLEPDSRATVLSLGGFDNGRFANPAYVGQRNAGTPAGVAFRIAEADFPIRSGWFYHATQNGNVKSGEYLMQRYLATVGNGGAMDLGIAPDDHGRLNENDVASLARFGDLRRAFFAHEVTDPREGFNVVVLKEDVIAAGELVDGWELLVDGKVVFSGRSVGIKRIRVSREILKGVKVTFRVTDSAKGPAHAPVDVKLYRADAALVASVLDAQKPQEMPKYRLPATCVKNDGRTMDWRFRDPQTFTSVVLAPDAKDPSGTPIAFTLSFLDEAGRWSAPTKAYRLGNVAANPEPQAVTLASPVRTRYVRLHVAETLSPGVKPSLASLTVK